MNLKQFEGELVKRGFECTGFVWEYDDKFDAWVELDDANVNLGRVDDIEFDEPTAFTDYLDAFDAKERGGTYSRAQREGAGVTGGTDIPSWTYDYRYDFGKKVH